MLKETHLESPPQSQSSNSQPVPLLLLVTCGFSNSRILKVQTAQQAPVVRRRASQPRREMEDASQLLPGLMAQAHLTPCVGLYSVMSEDSVRKLASTVLPLCKNKSETTQVPREQEGRFQASAGCSVWPDTGPDSLRPRGQRAGCFALAQREQLGLGPSMPFLHGTWLAYLRSESQKPHNSSHTRGECVSPHLPCFSPQLQPVSLL